MHQFSWWSRAKPGYQLGQFLAAIGARAGWKAAEGRHLSGHAVASVLALVITVVGSVFIGGALWVAQGAHWGAGDAMGIGILVSLGAALVLLGLGTALACSVTYVIHLPLQPHPEDMTEPQVTDDAIHPQVVEDAPEPQEAVRPKRARWVWWPFGQRA
jgi:hypothetical protein